MSAAAAAQEFEQAAVERNRLAAVRSLLERQRVANAAVGTLDAIAVALAGHRRQRAGLPGPRRRPLRPPVLLPRQRGAAPARARCSRSSCCSTTSTPPRCRRWSSSRSRSRRSSPRRSSARRGGRVEVRASERGEKRRILQLAARNATLALEEEQLKSARRRERRAEALDGLRDALVAAGGPDADRVLRHLEPAGHPRRRLDGRVRGRRARSARTTGGSASARSTGSDDFASMAEVLGRRDGGRGSASRTPRRTSPATTASFAALPNLIVIDGGKGQLSAGLEPLAAARAQGVAVISLAKRLEEIFVPGRSEPIVLAARDRRAAAARADPRRGAPRRDHPSPQRAATAR